MTDIRDRLNLRKFINAAGPVSVPSARRQEAVARVSPAANGDVRRQAPSLSDASIRAL